MARGMWKSGSLSEWCSECQSPVELLNNDVQFSMEVHKLSHKSAEVIKQEIDMRLRESQHSRSDPRRNLRYNYACPERNEPIEVYNNDVAFSLKQHAKTHRSQNAGPRSEDQLSTSSGSSKNSSKKIKSVDSIQKIQPDLSIVDAVFEIMPPGLKCHRGFILENDDGKAFCSVCKVTVEPMINVAEHLKTKSHEDNTISLLKEKIPADLRHQIMEFVSFYGSNLCCNSCRCKIDLCSTNLHETVVNIMSHNIGKIHLSRKASSEHGNQTDGALVMLNSLARINPQIKENKDLITYEMQPSFKCGICNKQISYSLNEQELMKNFLSHLNSSGHKRCTEITSILKTYNSIRPKNCEHNFTVSKNNIYCTDCSSTVEANVESLIFHSREPPTKGALGLASGLTKLTLNSPTFKTCDISPSSKGSSLENFKTFPTLMPTEATAPQETVPSKAVNLKALLDSLPIQLRNINYLYVNDEGLKVTCSICECVIPSTTYNIKTHVMGGSHKKKEQAIYAVKDKTVITEKNDKTLPISQQNGVKLIKTPPNENDYFFCSACNLNIPTHSNCLQEHLEGINHTTAVRLIATNQGKGHRKNLHEGDILLENLIKTDRIIKSFSKYLVRKNENYLCIICKSTITRSYDEELFKGNLMDHATGWKHKKSVGKVLDEIFENLKMSDPVIAANKAFLTRQGDQIYCTLCGCSMALSGDIDNVRKNIVPHFTGNKHMENKKNILEKEPSSVFTSGSSSLSIEGLFKMLPGRYQGDIAHIKNSPAEGFLSCSLCVVTIRPQSLRDHLDEGTHVQKKAESTTSFNLIDF